MEFLFDELPKRMDNLGDGITRGTTRLVRAVATGIGATVVDTTKVDTGAARSNWRATITAPATGTIAPYVPGTKLGIGETANANAAKSQHKRVFERFDATKHVGVFITNNVPHIGALNNGSTVHAPGNMVAKGLQTGRLVLRASKVLDTRK